MEKEKIIPKLKKEYSFNKIYRSKNILHFM